MIRNMWIIVFLAVSLLAPRAVEAAVGVGVKAGTLGFGGDITVGLHENFGVRIGGSMLNYTYEDTIDDIDYELELDYQSFSALADLYPFGGNFRLSAGAIINNNEIGLTAAPNIDKVVGDTAYTAAEIGTISGTLDFDSLAPYIGFGFGNAANQHQRFVVTLDIGVVIQPYEVDLAASGTLAADANFQADLAAEEAALQKDLDQFEFYPVVALGFAFRF